MATQFALESTAFYPLTGNPVGFHHLLLAECTLRQFTEVKYVVFILSNGLHPDPTKEMELPEKYVRLKVFQAALREFHDPQKSHIAKLAEQAKDPLKLTEKNATISTLEFDVESAFRLQDHLRHIREHATEDSKLNPIKFIVGADLLFRMNNPHIFTDDDMKELEQNCEFIAAPREQNVVEEEISQLQQNRQVVLLYHFLNIQLLPKDTQLYLRLSSTMIRKSAQAQHTLNCFLPKSAAQRVMVNKIYQQTHINIRLTEWQNHCWELEGMLETIVIALKNLLDEREDEGKPHRIALIECTTGGKIASSFCSLAGASRHFEEGLVLYTRESQLRIFPNLNMTSVVSEAHAIELAQFFKTKTTADYVLAESGMAGPPEGIRHSTKNGQNYFALATHKGVAQSNCLSNPFLTKKEHQLLFAINALQWFMDGFKDEKEIWL